MVEFCAWINGWVNNGEAGDLRCHCTHYDVTVMETGDSVTGSQRIYIENISNFFASTVPADGTATAGRLRTSSSPVANEWLNV